MKWVEGVENAFVSTRGLIQGGGAKGAAATRILKEGKKKRGKRERYER